MGAGQSTPEDVLKIVNEPVSYIPPLEVNPTKVITHGNRVVNFLQGSEQGLPALFDALITLKQSR